MKEQNKLLEHKRQELLDMLETPHLVRRWGEKNIRECLAYCDTELQYINKISELEARIKELKEEKTNLIHQFTTNGFGG